MRSFRQEPFRSPKIRPVRLSRTGTEQTGIYGGASDIWILQEIWIPVLPSVWLIRRTEQRSVSVQGAGIVADSVPEKEFQECCNKARAVVQAIETHRRDGDE